MLDVFQDIFESFRSINACMVFVFLPIVFLAVPCCASSDFPVFRLQGFESGSFKNGNVAA